MKLVLRALVLITTLVSVYSNSQFCEGESDGKLIATMFSKCTPLRDQSNCPAEKWLELFKESDMKKGSKTSYKIMNVGFNKGYNFAEWLNIFAPSMKIDVPHWYAALQKVPGLTQGCGACNDCNTPPIHSPHVGQPDPHIHIIGVDLNKANLFTVNSVIGLLNQTHNLSQLKLELVHAAGGVPSTAAGATNTLKIPRCPNGNEMCKIPDDPSKMDPNQEFDNVPLVGVDSLVHDRHILKSVRAESRGDTDSEDSSHHKRHGTDVLDILHIDTEGNDAEVIKSTVQLLKTHKIRALIFEYHEFMPWGRTKLSEVSAEISKNDYECFMQGQDRLWPITGACWDEQYEFHSWSNVMCVLRSDPWFQAIVPLVQTVPKLRAPIKDGTLLNLQDHPEIYIINDGKRDRFSDWDAFANRGYSKRGILRTTESCMVNDLFPEGELLQ